MQKINLPIPQIGLQLKVAACDLTHLNSDLPVIRVIFDPIQKVWVVIPPTQKRGFIIFLERHPGMMVLPEESFTVTLDRVSDSCGFAKIPHN